MITDDFIAAAGASFRVKCRILTHEAGERRVQLVWQSTLSDGCSRRKCPNPLPAGAARWAWTGTQAGLHLACALAPNIRYFAAQQDVSITEPQSTFISPPALRSPYLS